MCAIAGILDLPVDSHIINKMMKTMQRRGPDDNGYAVMDNCVLLHTRLQIIDPIGGAQPMKLKWGEEEYCISYNGELYNTLELRDELWKCGHTFQGHSDTEVVLHAYAQWQEGCVDRFNGIFAFAISASRNKKLFLARDRMGVKPLFYKEHEGGLLFASEIKTILAYPTVTPELDAQGAAEILLLGPGRISDSGVFRGICSLEPGACATYSDGKLSLRKYWRLRDREHTDAFPETVEYVRWLVTDAIKRQMVSDVPIGTFLSGGLDSSIISAICAGEMGKNGEKLTTFSVDYEGNDRFFIPGKFQPNRDNDYIDIMQKELESRHHWTIITPKALVDALEESTIARDLPGMADVDFSLLIFCKDISRNVKVALSGECADEIFGGYPWFRDPEVRSKVGFPWAQNTAMRSELLTEAIRQQINPEEFVMDQYEKTINDTDILPGTTKEEVRMKQMVNLNYCWFMQTLLDRKDRMSMYSGLEVRVPFCDYRIAEYMYGVPWEFKDYHGQEKGLLRQAMTGILPEQVLWRKKSPYPKTFHPEYLEIVRSRLERIMQDPSQPVHQILNREALKKLLDADFTWPWYGQLMKLPQTIAYVLQINCWLNTYKVKIV